MTANKEMKMKKNKLWLILGVLIISIAGVGAEIWFGIDDIGNFFVFDRILPTAMLNVMNLAPAVIDVYVDPVDNSTQVWWDEDYYLDQNLSSDEITDYLRGIDYLFTSNDYTTTTFPGYQFPSCHWDYGTNQKIGVYWFDGEQVPIPNDPKCE